MPIPEIKLGDQLPQVRLQILLAKLRLSSSEVNQANRLLADIDDWQALSDGAARNFNLPLMRRSLGALDQDLIPEGFRDQIRKRASATAFQNMQMVAAQKRFQDRCLKPLGIQGVFFKGVSMAAQYYPDLGLRPCRDIDVLLPKGLLKQVLIRAVEAGYTPVSPDANVIPMTSAQDIDAIIRFSDSATIVAPEGVVIDLQDHLDKHSGIFSSYDLVNATEPLNIAGTSFATLPTEFLFNYLCHHHTRHTWSRLHWLSDLDAICTSSRFKREAALDLAEELGQRGTVEASLELHQLMSTDTPWDDSDSLARGKSFLKLCILNLPGDLSLEKQLSLKIMGGEFMYQWQARPDLIARARRRWWRTIFQPTVSQYAKIPLPRALQWLYFIQRPFELMLITLKRAGPIKR